MEFDFKDLLKNMDCLYTQMLNGERIREKDVVYVFDEVGCGKTVSAIIAMASIIKEKKNQNYKILVLTPKSVCNQFAGEIKNKLKISETKIINIAHDINVDENLEKIKNQQEFIIVANPQKAKKLVSIQNNKSNESEEENIQNENRFWDLVIIDEAHDIVCNNNKQIEVYYKDKINKAYEVYEKICFSLNKDRSDKIKTFIENNEEKNRYIGLFMKYLLVEEYNNVVSNKLNDGTLKNNVGMIPIDNSRIEGTEIFKNISLIKAKKVMFLTATPYKNNKDIDFLNYALMATKIITNFMFTMSYLPNLNWVQDFYTGKFEHFEEFKKSNTSLLFKEIAQSVPFEGNSRIEGGKDRIVEIWKENEKKSKDISILRQNILEIREKDKNSRFIIFVSSSSEGQEVFKKIFPGNDHDMTKFPYEYRDENSKLLCKFIMSKFDNRTDLENYASEAKSSNSKEQIPDILIVTWQVAQVGVNLPTFNYVVNYHIPSIPGYLEQRYGRIDRLNSDKNPLHNVYYQGDTNSTLIYKTNLIKALYLYKKDIMDVPHNMPVKNLLLCDELSVGVIGEEFIDELYKSLAFYLFYYLKDDKMSDGTLWEVRTAL